MLIKKVIFARLLQTLCQTDTSRPIFFHTANEFKYLSETIIPSIVADESWSVGENQTYWTDIVGEQVASSYIWKWGTIGRGEYGH